MSSYLNIRLCKNKIIWLNLISHGGYVTVGKGIWGYNRRSLNITALVIYSNWTFPSCVLIFFVCDAGRLSWGAWKIVGPIPSQRRQVFYSTAIFSCIMQLRGRFPLDSRLKGVLHYRMRVVLSHSTVIKKSQMVDELEFASCPSCGEWGGRLLPSQNRLPTYKLLLILVLFYRVFDFILH